MAGLGLSTVVDFEKERRQVSQEAVSAIQHSLEQAGIELIAENGRRSRAPLKKVVTKEKQVSARAMAKGTRS